MDIYDELELKITTSEPTVWLERVVLFEQIDPEPVVIREVKLSRGLNIVWADEPGEDAPDTEITGHSAGKTAFCRLIRYLLGENSFGTKANTSFIRKALPKAYIAAEIHVCGHKRTVIRPIGNGRASYVQSNLTIEATLKQRGFPIYHESYLSALGVLPILDGFETGGIVQTGEPIQWGHILAWITRDQEARFQDIHEWRSPRSESDAPRFQFPKAGPLFVMRTALGLILPDELVAEEELAKLTRRQAKLEKEIEDLRKEPQFRVNLYDRQLRQKLVQLGLAATEVDGLAFESEGLIPGLDKKAQRLLATLEAEIVTKNEQIEAKDAEINETAARIGGLEREQEQLDSLFGLNDAALTELDKGLRKRRHDRSLLEKYRNDKCVLGDVFYKDCSYVQSRRATLNKIQLQDAQAMEFAEAERKKEQQQVDSDKQSIQDQIDELKHSQEAMRQEQRTLKRELKAKDDDLNEVRRVHSSLTEWRDRMSNSDGFEELANCKSELANAVGQSVGLEADLNRLIGQHEAHRSLLNKIFSASVRSVLPSGTYDGIVRLDGGELSYQITHGPAMSGEAVETLSVLLSDISNLIYSSVSERAHLPGFLLHDSPREADLGIRIYWSFIRFVARLQSHFGSAEHCPFQYILTTTTAPPKELAGDDFVKLPLSASDPNELLYRRVLATAAAVTGAASIQSPVQKEIAFEDFEPPSNGSKQSPD